ncbi:MAG TPA: hypothetical protein P5572_02905 [Phycisphaerae bacterium]|nr:hypothetical protein [Phycisphaerales bacterium]HRX83949.1 hypothetical protein [Phycisphaerae bacterium]
MIEKNDNVTPAPEGGSPPEATPAATSRREFLVGVGAKAVYITPVLLTLSATPAVASPHAVSCKPLAGSCTTNHDCCSNNCDTNVCI